MKRFSHFFATSFLLCLLPQTVTAEAKAESGPELVPSKEVPAILITPDSKLKVFADHANGGVTSPTALTIDEKGRVLVTETWRFGVDLGIDDNRRRRHWLLDDIASQTTDDRLAMYKKWYRR